MDYVYKPPFNIVLDPFGCYDGKKNFEMIPTSEKITNQWEETEQKQVKILHIQEQTKKSYKREVCYRKMPLII